MSMRLNLPADLQSRLEQQAELAGQDAASFVLEVVRERLRDLDADGLKANELSNADWSGRLQAWADSFPQVSHSVDDSRESIYEDRS